MSILGINGSRLRRLLLSSISGFRGLIPYSTSSSAAETAPSQGQIHFMVDYLVNSLGFSREAAITASTKISHLKSTEKPDSVVNFFKQNGLDNAQIRRIVSSVPTSLTSSVEKNLEPKFKFLQDLGLSGSDLAKLISGNPCFFNRRIETHLILSINYLKGLVGSEEDVVKAIRKSKWLLSSGVVLQRMPSNVLLLKEYGFSNGEIKKLILLNPRVLLQKSEWLQEVMHRTEVELGIPRESPMFSRGLYVMASNSKSRLEMVFGIFRSFGWTDSHINTLARKSPNSLSLSEAKIRNGLKFFMKELGFSSEYLAHHPALFNYSLEKRVMPRNEVLKILKEKQVLNSKLGLYTVLCRSEAKFVDHFLLPHRDAVPDLYKAYMKRTK